MKIFSELRFCLYVAVLGACSCANAAPQVNGPTASDKPGFSAPPPMVASIQSRFHTDDTDTITYRYTVTNDAQNKQDIGLIIFDQVGQIIGTRDDREFKIKHEMDSSATAALLEQNSAALTTPEGWEGSISFGMYNEESIRLGWNPVVNESTGRASDGIKPGTSLPGFGFFSHDLPGIGQVEMEGNSTLSGIPKNNTNSDVSIIRQLMQLEQSDHAQANAAVPTIRVPIPFDSAVILERVQDHMKTWTEIKLLDRAFYSKLRRSSQEAIKAYRLNDHKDARDHLEEMRMLINKEQPDSDKTNPQDESNDSRYPNRGIVIDKLAARVLDFDIKYVINHSGGKD